MKKIFVAILAVVYLGVSSGIAMNIHYCMGKVASVDLMHSSEKCGKCGMKNNDKNGCCKDEFKIVKLDDSHKLITNDINFFSPLIIFDDTKISLNGDIPTLIKLSGYNNHSPPTLSGASICILNCAFRI